MNTKITIGDIIRHCDDEDLARIILLKNVEMVAGLLSAMSDDENLLKFLVLFHYYSEDLIKEQAAWLSQPIENIMEKEE